MCVCVRVQRPRTHHLILTYINIYIYIFTPLYLFLPRNPKALPGQDPDQSAPPEPAQLAQDDLPQPRSPSTNVVKS